MDSEEQAAYAARVSRRVAETIHARGTTQVAVSEMTGIPRVTLIRRLGGRTPFTVAELGAIASALEVDVTRFIVDPEEVDDSTGRTPGGQRTA